VVGLLVGIRQAPVHTSGKIVLEGFSPPEQTCIVTVVDIIFVTPRVFRAGVHFKIIVFLLGLCVPLVKSRRISGLFEFEPAAPASVSELLRIAEARGKQVQICRRIALVLPFALGIERTKRAVITDIFRHPFGCESLQIRPGHMRRKRPCDPDRYCLEHVHTAKPKYIGEVVAYPAAAIVLTSDVIDTYFRDKDVQFLVTATVGYVPQHLRKVGWCSPDGDPDGAFVLLIHNGNYVLRRFRTSVPSDTCHIPVFASGFDQATQKVSGRIAAGMFDKIRPDLVVSFDSLVYLVRIDLRAHRRRDQALQIEFVGVQQQSNHRLLVIGISTDIGQNQESFFVTCTGKRNRTHG